MMPTKKSEPRQAKRAAAPRQAESARELEMEALRIILDAIDDLGRDAGERVLNYALQRNAEKGRTITTLTGGNVTGTA